jgi:phosphoribosylaminoimidazole-succinocarboxamide synthase
MTSQRLPDAATGSPFMGLAELGVTPAHGGKVREILDLGRDLLIVTTDRISAFDFVMPTGIPGKGIVLNRISAFWFRGLADFLPTHFLDDEGADLPPVLRPHAARLAGRCTRVRKAERVPVECVVRGWLTGSGYASYRESGTVCGVALPPGLAEFDRLPEPIFTPTSKADQGHDLAMTYPELRDLVGVEAAGELRRLSLEIFARGTAYAESRGIVIADTKFEFGVIDGRLALIDEVLTPDSSRFWPRDSVGPGRKPVSLDKQVLRDYLLGTGWDRARDPPGLPPEIVAQTSRRYAEVAARLLGDAARPIWNTPPTARRP